MNKFIKDLTQNKKILKFHDNIRGSSCAKAKDSFIVYGLKICETLANEVNVEFISSFKDGNMIKRNQKLFLLEGSIKTIVYYEPIFKDTITKISHFAIHINDARQYLSNSIFKGSICFALDNDYYENDFFLLKYSYNCLSILNFPASKIVKSVDCLTFDSDIAKTSNHYLEKYHKLTDVWYSCENPIEFEEVIKSKFTSIIIKWGPNFYCYMIELIKIQNSRGNQIKFALAIKSTDLLKIERNYFNIFSYIILTDRLTTTHEEMISMSYHLNGSNTSLSESINEEDKQGYSESNLITKDSEKVCSTCSKKCPQKCTRYNNATRGKIGIRGKSRMRSLYPKLVGQYDYSLSWLRKRNSLMLNYLSKTNQRSISYFRILYEKLRKTQIVEPT